MNYRHSFHAGNHADVLKHVVVLALCEAMTAKATALFALDTHAGRGLYRLKASIALRTGESEDGVRRLLATPSRDPALIRYRDAIDACRKAHGPDAYPGSPWLLAHALRPVDRIACCELQPIEAAALRNNFAHDPRMQTEQRDGYAALKALLPPKHGTLKFGRGLVLIDPPYETQLAEFDTAIDALREGLQRWPQGTFALWYPIKLRRALQPFFRRAAALPAKSALIVELLVRSDDSPLRMNGSGMLMVNAPWRFEQPMLQALAELRKTLGEDGASSRVEYLRAAT